MVCLLRNGMARPFQTLLACDPQLIRRSCGLAGGNGLCIQFVLVHLVGLAAIRQGTLGWLFFCCETPGLDRREKAWWSADR